MLTEQLLAYSNYRLRGGWCVSLGVAAGTAVCEGSLTLTQTEQTDALWSLWIFVIYP